MKSGHLPNHSRKTPLFLGPAVCLAIALLVAHAGLLNRLIAAVCNQDGICSYDEYSSKGTCADCAAKTYPPLAVNQTGSDLFTMGNDSVTSCKYKIFQFKCVGTEVINGETFGRYADSWASVKTAQDFPAVSEGDADNDGTVEAVALISGTKGSKLSLYKSGSAGGPSWESPYFAKGMNRNSVRIGDVDRDGLNEVVTDIGDQIHICRITRSGASYAFKVLWTGPSYGVMIWTIDIGDADNLGDPEIILSVFQYGAPIVLKRAGAAWEVQPIEKIWAPFTPAIDMAKVRDVDGAWGNEIVAGGNNNRIMVWKWDGTMYRLVATSADLGGFTQGVDAGEVDPELPGNEIVTSAAGGTGTSTAYVLKYTGGTLAIVSSTGVSGSTNDVCAKDLDGDGLCEIGIAIHPTGLEIYELVLANKSLVRRFSCVYGSAFERDGRD